MSYLTITLNLFHKMDNFMDKANRLKPGKLLPENGKLASWKIGLLENWPPRYLWGWKIGLLWLFFGEPNVNISLILLNSALPIRFI